MKFLLFDKNRGYGRYLKEELSIDDIDIELIDFKLPLFSYNPKIFTKKAVKYASNKLDEEVILLISSFEIDELNGFPSFFSEFVEGTIGVKKITNTISNMNKRCVYKSLLAYCEPQRNPIIFEENTKGKLKTFSKDMSSFEKIFVPNGQVKSFINEKVNKEHNPNLKSIKKFKSYINKKNNGFNIELKKSEVTIFAPKEGNMKINVKFNDFPKITLSLPIEKPDLLIDKFIHSSKRYLRKEIANREIKFREDQIKINFNEDIEDDILLWLKELYGFSKELKKMRDSEKYMKRYNEIQDNLIFETENENQD